MSQISLVDGSATVICVCLIGHAVSLYKNPDGFKKIQPLYSDERRNGLKPKRFLYQALNMLISFLKLSILPWKPVGMDLLMVPVLGGHLTNFRFWCCVGLRVFQRWKINPQYSPVC